MKTLFVLLAVMALSVCVSPSLAASTTMYVAGSNHTVRTNTGGGSCTSLVEDDDSTTTVCHEGDNSTTINDEVGCVYSKGSGQCVIGDLPTNAYPMESVSCPGASGRTFDITATVGHCETSRGTDGNVTGVKCYNANGQVVSEMSCNCNSGQGCCLSEVSGSGTCGNERDLH